MKLSIVIPVYNEEKTIDRIIKEVEAVNISFDKEIILVDDGSRDRSRNILNTYAGRYKVLFQDHNQGKGAALRRGFAGATRGIVFVQDSHLEYKPEDYPALIRPIVEGQADVVYGSRFIGSSASQNIVIYRHGYLFSRVLNGLSNFLSGVKLSDMYTCYKVFSREAIKKIYPMLISNRFGFDPEITALIAREKLRIAEVPISYKGRTYEEGKKINWKDGIAAIFHIIRFNL